MAWRLISTRVGAALLLPQRAFVPAVVALQVAESHVRGRAGLQPGVVVRLNGHERLQDLVELEVNLVSRELPRHLAPWVWPACCALALASELALATY